MGTNGIVNSATGKQLPAEWERQPDDPRPGYYTRTLRKGCRDNVPVHIWLDPSGEKDKITNRPKMLARAIKNRTWQWENVDVWEVWPECADKITAVYAHYLIEEGRWFATYFPESSRGDPLRPIDLLSEPVVYFWGQH